MVLGNGKSSASQLKIFVPEECQQLCCRAFSALSRAFSRSRRQPGNADEANRSIPELVIDRAPVPAKNVDRALTTCAQKNLKSAHRFPVLGGGAVRSEMQRLGVRRTRLETQHELVRTDPQNASTLIVHDRQAWTSYIGKMCCANAGTSTGTTSRLDEAVMRA